MMCKNIFFCLLRLVLGMIYNFFWVHYVRTEISVICHDWIIKGIVLFGLSLGVLYEFSCK